MIYGFPATMEIQSGNGEEEEEEVAAATWGSVSQSAPGRQVEASDEEPQGARRIERFNVPLDSLKRIFERSPVSAAAASLLFCFSSFTRSPL